MLHNVIDLRKSVQQRMNEKRFEHTLGVEYTACAMAMKYGVDITKAQLAGLLHDSAKCLPDDEMIQICEKEQIPFSVMERENPFLLHGKVGAFIAKTEYHISDEDILNAITYHTTGRPGMSALEKIIYIADFIEPNRKPLNCLSKARALAFTDLDECFLFVLEEVLDYLKKSGSAIDPLSQETYDSYVK